MTAIAASRGQTIVRSAPCDALKAFRAEFPTVSLHLYMEALGAVPQMVLDRKATIGICGPLDVEIPGLERIGVGSVEFIPVAAPDHPLARAGRNGPGAARDHIQLVLADRSPLADGKDRGVIGTQTWQLADLGSKHMLRLGGICPSRLCKRISIEVGTQSTAQIHRQAQPPPGLLPGSKPKRK